MSELKRQLVRLAHTNPDGIREHLLPILTKNAKGDEGEEEEGGKGKGPSGLFMKFLREEGDREISHPDKPGERIKIKSLKSQSYSKEKGWGVGTHKKVLEREFAAWRKKQEGKKEEK